MYSVVTRQEGTIQVFDLCKHELATAFRFELGRGHVSQVEKPLIATAR